MSVQSSAMPRPVQRLINELARLPGIGPKSAARLTFFLLRSSNDDVIALVESLQDLKEKTQFCSVCFNITEENPCPICADDSRDKQLLCVVEEPLDLLAIERSRAYIGLYHVLQGAISPVEGIGPDDLKIEELVQRVLQGEFREIIVATNPTLEGESTSHYLKKRLEAENLKLTGLARGLSVGGDLEYTDEITLGRAMEGRREL